MERKVLTVPLIFSIIVAAYLPPILRISIDNSNILVVFMTYMCVAVGLMNRKISFKRDEIFLLILQLAIATIAVKANLVSLTIIVLLNVFFNQYDDSANLDYYTKISFLFFILVVMSYYLFGFNKTYDSAMWRIDSLVDRSSIGFTQPNQAMIAWVGTFFGVSLKKNQSNKCIYLLLLVVSTLIYYETKSRTGYIILLAILGLMYIFRNSLDRKVSNLMKVFLVNLPLLLMGISAWMTTQANNSFLNSLLTGRPVLYKKFFDLAGVTLWGTGLIENQMLDNSYLSMLIGKGVVFTSLYLITLMYLVLSAREISVRTYIVFALFFIYGLTETMLFKFELLVPIIISLHITGNINPKDNQQKDRHYIK
ncbi:MAG: hypothetical protein LKE89_02080 [Lactobacillaceae bacterium]|jgi:hypothetical protein|nr:hypothetical protein [Lactobacillaceae bacterium]